MPVSCYIIIGLGAYLLGSIPFGFLAAKIRGIDIRSVGSGNIGATNAMRVLGKPIGIFVLLMDAVKGYLACAVLAPLIFDAFAPHVSGLVVYFRDEPADYQMRFKVLAAVCAVLGHNYTCWLKFKGGKGIATTAGVYIALAWPALLIALAVFVGVVWATRYISVGSITAAVVLPAVVWTMPPHNILLGTVTTALGVLAIYKHKSNIHRLMAGTENRFGQKKEASK